MRDARGLEGREAQSPFTRFPLPRLAQFPTTPSLASAFQKRAPPVVMTFVVQAPSAGACSHAPTVTKPFVRSSVERSRYQHHLTRFVTVSAHTVSETRAIALNAIGVGTMSVISATGLGAVIAASPVLFIGLQAAGALFLKLTSERLGFVLVQIAHADNLDTVEVGQDVACQGCTAASRAAGNEAKCLHNYTSPFGQNVKYPNFFCLPRNAAGGSRTPMKQDTECRERSILPEIVGIIPYPIGNCHRFYKKTCRLKTFCKFPCFFPHPVI